MRSAQLPDLLSEPIAMQQHRLIAGTILSLGFGLIFRRNAPSHFPMPHLLIFILVIFLRKERGIGRFLLVEPAEESYVIREDFSQGSSVF